MVKVSITCLLLFSCLKPKPRANPDYTNEKGYVIGREVCKSDSEDYWLIDLTFRPDYRQYGDTINLNGIEYRNVVKVLGLDPRFKQVGTRVSLDFKTVTATKIITTGCTTANSTTYALKELFIINQGEIR